MLAGMWKRVALIPFGLLLAIVGLELTLQAASWVAQARVRAGQPGSAGAGDLRVLCLGDSNTYGLYLDREESYPAQLEALWNATNDAPTLEVLNLGMPGTNSSWLVRESDRLLDTFQPDLVLLMVGGNDFWTRAYATDGSDGGWRRWLRYSKILRAIYMARKGHEAGVLEVVNRHGADRRDVPPPEEIRQGIRGGFDVRYGGEEFSMRFETAATGEQGDPQALRANLRTLIEKAEAHGATVALMSYPSRRFFYNAANEELKRIASALAVPLIDHDAIFAPLCPDESCPDLLFPDGHPKARGYHMMAEAIISWLSNSELASHP
jgi:lysophospholipase L1-like esterase